MITRHLRKISNVADKDQSKQRKEIQKKVEISTGEQKKMFFKNYGIREMESFWSDIASERKQVEITFHGREEFKNHVGKSVPELSQVYRKLSKLKNTAIINFRKNRVE